MVTQRTAFPSFLSAPSHSAPSTLNARATEYGATDAMGPQFVQQPFAADRVHRKKLVHSPLFA